MIKLSQLLKESDEEGGGTKATYHTLGLKPERIVISGQQVPSKKIIILNMIKKHDPTSTCQFFPATSKIVGIVSKVKIEFIKRDLKSLDPTATVISKPQVK